MDPVPAPFTLAAAAAVISVPTPGDDKYSRGVLGLVTGSERYPGAAVLGVEAAWRTGVGMVRYLGPATPSGLVLQRRPETVTAAGRVQAWVLGSGQDDDLDPETRAHLDAALADEVPTVLDGGAIGRHADARGAVVLTPHAGELARLLDVEVDAVRSDREGALRRAVDATGATVLLKGHETLVAGPGADPRAVTEAPSWLAVAGAGDVLAGVLGALLATRGSSPADPSGSVRIAAAAAAIHGAAATRASRGGPIVALDLCAELPRIVADLADAR